jgi:hypothetical protein
MLNEILGAAARFEQLLTRRFNVLGGAPSPQLTPEITPVYAFLEQAQDQALMAVKLCTASLSQAAVAAKRGVLQLRNPTGSGIVAVVTRVAAFHTDAGAQTQSFAVGLVPGDLANLPAAGGITVRDTRWTGAPTCRFTSDASPATILNANLALQNTSQNQQLEYLQPVVLSPGFSLQMSLGANNIVYAGSVAWAEIPLAPGEIGPF